MKMLTYVYECSVVSLLKKVGRDEETKRSLNFPESYQLKQTYEEA